MTARRITSLAGLIIALLMLGATANATNREEMRFSDTAGNKHLFVVNHHAHPSVGTYFNHFIKNPKGKIQSITTGPKIDTTMGFTWTANNTQHSTSRTIDRTGKVKSSSRTALGIHGKYFSRTIDRTPKGSVITTMRTWPINAHTTVGVIKTTDASGRKLAPTRRFGYRTADFPRAVGPKFGN